MRLSERVTDDDLKKKVLKEAAKPVISEAKQIARRVLGTRTGELIKSISDKYNTTTGRQNIGWQGDDDAKNIGFYGFFHEVGYKPFKGVGIKKIAIGQKRKTAARGNVPPKPHIKPALDSKKEEVIKTMIDMYDKVLNKR